MRPEQPSLSVVVVTDAYPTIRKLVECLLAQDANEAVELVVVAARGARVELSDGALAGRWGVQRVEVEALESLSWARAPGIRAARAPVVALAESHAFPQAGWARALIDAHAGPWAAVGPAMDNANPWSPVSWANLLLDYGPWVPPAARGERDDLPGHNSSYKRTALAPLDGQLPRLLEAESFLHARLLEMGERLLFEPRARVRHTNVSRLDSWVPERVAAGRRYAGARAVGWSRPRRLLWAAASPAIPVVRLRRLLALWWRRRAQMPRGSLAAIVASLLMSALGEALGYVAGSGDSMQRLERIELHKERYLYDRERSALER